MIDETMAAVLNDYKAIREHWPVLSSILSMFPSLIGEVDKQLEICRILDEDNAIPLSLVYFIVNGEALEDDRGMIYGFMNVKEERGNWFQSIKEDQNDDDDR